MHAADDVVEADVDSDAEVGAPAVPFCQVYPWVRLPEHVRPRLSAIARDFHDDTGGYLRVTSGTRIPEEQAWLMYDKLARGENVVAIYANKSAARAIRRAYRAGRKDGLDEHAVIGKMTDVIRDQVARGIYISRHLEAGALDIGARGMSSADRKRFKRIARRHGARVLDETRTRRPHFHVTFRRPASDEDAG